MRHAGSSHNQHMQAEGASYMQMTIVGIDISKHVCQLPGMDAQGKARVTQRVARANLLKVMAQ